MKMFGTRPWPARSRRTIPIFNLAQNSKRCFDVAFVISRPSSSVVNGDGEREERAKAAEAAKLTSMTEGRKTVQETEDGGVEDEF